VIVELYGGPGDGVRSELPDDQRGMIFRHWMITPRGQIETVEYYERRPDGVPYEEIAAPDGTQRLMVPRREKEGSR